MPADSPSSPVWFITGCSTGFGRALAERVLQRGFRCVATARDAARLETLAAQFPDTALVLPLDVTDGAQVEQAVSRAIRAFGVIDVLVNNAGRGYSAAIEEGEDAVVRAMFETNFFGLVAVTKRVLPLMRARGRGHIINVSSVGGIVGNPATGYYNASKFAVEGLTQALAKEVDPLGIRVTLIEPGPFRTDFQGRSMTAVENPIDAYAGTAAARRAQLKASSGKQPGDPVRAADAIILVTQSEKPPLHLVLGKNGLDRVRAKLTELQHTLDEWEQVTLSADYPPRHPNP
jgi:NAD(P)-dependent dehydrogenase (short-subunit alcohol dehydrogenase family)